MNIKKLIRLANYLHSAGFVKEAIEIKKIASESLSEKDLYILDYYFSLLNGLGESLRINIGPDSRDPWSGEITPSLKSDLFKYWSLISGTWFQNQRLFDSIISNSFGSPYITAPIEIQDAVFKRNSEWKDGRIESIRPEVALENCLKFLKIDSKKSKFIIERLTKGPEGEMSPITELDAEGNYKQTNPSWMERLQRNEGPVLPWQVQPKKK